jgi:hypothetical protein
VARTPRHDDEPSDAGLDIALVGESRGGTVPVAAKNSLRSNSSNSPALAMASSSSGIL